MNETPFPRIGAAVIATDQRGRILLGKRAKPGNWHDYWVLPGGQIKPFETMQDAAIREFREETGLGLRTWDKANPAINYLGSQWRTYEIIALNEHRIIVFYEARIADDKALRAGGDLSKVAWFWPHEMTLGQERANGPQRGKLSVTPLIREVLADYTGCIFLRPDAVKLNAQMKHQP
jgi:8-oxo-dGTP pyrophosphatase MutT (NUDIX family)